MNRTDLFFERKKFGFLLTRITYFVTMLIFFVVYVISSRAFEIDDLFKLLFIFFSAWLLKKLEDSPVIIYAIVQNLLFSLLFLTAYSLFKLRASAYLEIMLLTMINACIMEVSVFLIQFIMQSLQFVLLYLGFFAYSDDSLTLFALIGIEIIYAATITVGILMCRYVNNEKRKAIEQEQSLDDLLKVVEAKVDVARSASRARAEFLSNMSHEIRTPINSILGMNTLILREANDREIRKYAANIQSSGKLLLAIINDILDFSKIERGKMDIVPVNYHLSSLLNDIGSMTLPMAHAKHLAYEVIVNPRIPDKLSGDDVRIKQILMNLLSNAVKYTDKGTVTLKVDFIRISYGKILLNISVSDTGRGIRTEDIDTLFDAFSRTDEKKNRSIQGTGLGLSIANNLVKLMGGKFIVESAYGLGTTFSFAILQTDVDPAPIGDYSVRSEPDTELPEEHYKESFIAPEARILAVDDNELNLKVVRGLLKNLKLNIDTVTCGKECIEACENVKEEGGYDLIFLDHMMPEMDGIETFRLLKEQHLIDNTPVIALTANAIAGAREMFLNEGFTDYLPKPIEGKDLEDILHQYLPDDKVIIR